MIHTARLLSNSLQITSKLALELPDLRQEPSPSYNSAGHSSHRSTLPSTTNLASSSSRRKIKARRIAAVSKRLVAITQKLPPINKAATQARLQEEWWVVLQLSL
jgi:hypothetical protein